MVQGVALNHLCLEIWTSIRELGVMYSADRIVRA